MNRFVYILAEFFFFIVVLFWFFSFFVLFSLLLIKCIIGGRGSFFLGLIFIWDRYVLVGGYFLIYFGDFLVFYLLMFGIFLVFRLNKYFKFIFINWGMMVI